MSDSSPIELAPAAGSARLPPTAGIGRIGYLGAAVLGGVLLFAAYAKAIDPAAFAQQVHLEGLDFGGAAFAWAVAAIALEVGIGVALVLNLRRRAVLVAATLLVGLFVFLTARTFYRASHGLLSAADAASCGCFGNLVERTPAQAFWQDVALLVPALALAWVGRPASRRGVPARGRAALALVPLVPVIAAGAAAIFAAAAPGLPLDDFATRAKPGTAIAGLCAGRGEQRICLPGLVPGLASGRHWLVLVDVHAADFPALASTLNAYVASAAEPPLTVLADLTQEEQMELFWRLAPAFELHETPAALLRPLYRKLPRTLFVEEGRVTRTYPGLPAEIASAADSNNPKTDDPRP